MANNGEADRYRRATEDLFQQLDWCIGYLHGIRKGDIAGVLSKNRSYIREKILDQVEETVPSQVTSE